jgi:hypothetical protein
MNKGGAMTQSKMNNFSLVMRKVTINGAGNLGNGQCLPTDTACALMRSGSWVSDNGEMVGLHSLL